MTKKFPSPSPRTAFTLIELLIVVAIIAILAAIAVPNFLEAQTRAKVSRARADLRSLITALEAYRVDSNAYPPDFIIDPIIVPSVGRVTAEGLVPPQLSTPVAYITSARIKDPFINQGAHGVTADPNYFTLWYQNVDTSVQAALGDPSPYDIQDPPFTGNAQSIKFNAGWGNLAFIDRYGKYKLGSIGPDQNYTGGFDIYDPTNGTVSDGDIYRTQLRPDGGF